MNSSISSCSRLFTLLFVIVAPVSLSAQTIGDEALQRAQSGDVTFLEGEFIAYLADTVSPDFVREQLASEGFEITSENIEPIMIKVFYGPSDSTLNKIEAHPLITELKQVSPQIDTTAIMNDVLTLGVPMSQREQVLQRMIDAENVPEFIITFDYPVNERRAKQIMGEFRNVAYDLLSAYPRTVNIKTEPGNEPEIMEQVEKLTFVESAAMIAILNE